MIPFNQVKLVFLFIINKNVNFECISIAKHIINLFNDKFKVKYIRKLVKKSYTPVVPIANTCSIGYPHDSRADNAAYRHDRRADNAAYRHDRRADSLSRCWLNWCSLGLFTIFRFVFNSDSDDFGQCPPTVKEKLISSEKSSSSCIQSILNVALISFQNCPLFNSE